MTGSHEIYKIIGGKIRKYRLASGLTPKELAAKVLLSRPSIINIENGVHRIQIHTLFLIAEALNIDIVTLIIDNIELKQCSK